MQEETRSPFFVPKSPPGSFAILLNSMQLNSMEEADSLTRLAQVVD